KLASDGHHGVIEAVAFTADGRGVLTTAVDQTLLLWDAATGKEIRRIDQPRGSISELAVSPDGKTLAARLSESTNTAKLDCSILLLDAGVLEVRQRITDREKSVVSPAFAPDGQTLAYTTADGKAHLWALQAGRDLRVFDAVNMRIRLQFSRDGRTLFGVR